jgi:5-methyltetrahydropteroyltriglutamate--homocysteine methyltransferase
MALSNVAGFPRIGPNRELKFATEGYWRGETSAGQLASTASEIRRANWTLMRDAGIDLIPSNDFSLYDQVLDAVALVGAVPERYGHGGGDVDLDTYFAMARGRQGDGVDVTAMEMTKWFDTNYHYIVPELGPDTRFSLSSTKPFDEFVEAEDAVGITTVPVLIGPVSFLLLGKSAEGVDEHFDRLSLIEPLLGVYGEVIERLAEHGADWVQLDEPCFVMDRSERELDALRLAYEELPKVHERTRLLVKTYFDHVGDAYAVLRETQVDGIGLDFSGRTERSEGQTDVVEGKENVGIARDVGPLEGKTLFAGIVDGHNVWINDLHASLEELRQFSDLADEVVISTSCSLLHTPVDLDSEPDLDDELRSWMAFAKQKVSEVATLARGLSEGNEAIETELADNVEALESRAESERTRNAAVRDRVEALGPDDARRASPFETRRDVQRAELDLPTYPTTTIGSYPQTADIRETRMKLRKGEIDWDEYERFMQGEIEKVIRFQDEVGLDVLVHGEPERNDMVQYFAEQMDGYVTTENAWVQSYGSRCVRPPILYGDVSRPQPITLDWIKYAQSLTERPVKGMLTGPVTMLQWSFVRDDQGRDETCKQLALAIRDEVADLVEAGIKVIQVDEPAIREGLPLRRENWGEYLDWAVYCFRVATSGVPDEIQIHTHMCYSEFRDIMDHISDLDADVLLIWHARSHAELLEYWRERGYDKDIAPGVWDIHSPRVPPTEEMVGMLREVAEALPPERLWVGPDCGLKTRDWPEVEASLRNMVNAAGQLREELVPAG